MVHLSGGTFSMGSNRFYPEEAPARPIRVDGFWIDRAPVTNREYLRFVQATGHVTLAEIAPDPADYPMMPAEMAQAGSLLFQRPAGAVDLRDFRQWWSFCAGTDWRHPWGPGSGIEDLADHPVVHVAYQDAEAYAAWCGKALPSEAEWEFAARGGLDDADYAWGDSLAPEGRMLANYWQGEFPCVNDLLDGWERTSPVGSFPPNGYGLEDMIGNVWEWTSDWWSIPRPARKRFKGACCVPSNPRGGKRSDSIERGGDAPRIARKVIKGGSHLCAANYCRRYRPAARHPQAIDSSTCHIGFRCVIRESR
ncbi:gliding motility-associated lipoprotein GldK [Tardibacter chloracetimidivorans]|uniref:Gliding motility-associated lipoprotein GldK n=1 Tax=Tardibacter chloracetimidivorans TaxID=1921510 RepID=A0A1L3ZZU5_9SPHN|nr:formylglycine-generating enzyme family protein [Tardibacter chloracetimidivorans]API61109.1 gliding motility-associated lipoprotein GldK [Tardibacter chloracetimidivorans]